MTGTHLELPDEFERVFALGDLHGCVRELDLMLTFLSLEVQLGPRDLVVFIGDYLDRGPDPRGVIERLISFRAGPSKCVFLRGNHEEMMIQYLVGKLEADDPFVRHECRQTFRSYRCPPGTPRDEFLDHFPESHREFLDELERILITPKFIFVHAGINPSRTLADQRNDDLLWIREPFLSSPHNLGKLVVFGHTPYQDVYFDPPFKLGIDTGLVFGNVLTCVELTSGDLYQLKKDADQVKRSSLFA